MKSTKTEHGLSRIQKWLLPLEGIITSQIYLRDWYLIGIFWIFWIFHLGIFGIFSALFGFLGSFSFNDNN